MEMLLDSDGCSDRNAGVLPEHLNSGLTRAEQAEDYAKHISSISKEYVPLSRARLLDRVAHGWTMPYAKIIPLFLTIKCMNFLKIGRLLGEWLGILILVLPKDV